LFPSLWLLDRHHLSNRSLLLPLFYDSSGLEVRTVSEPYFVDFGIIVSLNSSGVFVGGFYLTKDMAKGNQLGPYLVTPDDVGNPYNLKVTVVVNGQVKYQGSTSEVSRKAEDVFAWLGFMAPLKPGSAIGFGTIPDCTGCDHDDFIDPGAEIQITFERLGTLRCRFAEPTQKLLPSRWSLRPALQKFHG
jgi:hypothetical protein